MQQAKPGYRLWGKVLDGTLNAPIDNGVVVTKGDRIAWVGQAEALPIAHKDPSFEDIKLPGRTIMPGLIDGHTHISFGESRSEEENALYTPVEFRTLKAIWNANKVLQAGVTSAFDAATTYNIAQCVRDAIDTGMFPGPRFVVSGKQITNHQGIEDAFPNSMPFPEGQCGVLVKSVGDLIEQVRFQVKDEVDVIKVSGSNDNLLSPDSLDVSAFTYEELKVLADETHRLDKICSVHARSRLSALDAARAGFDVIFHASYIDDRGIEAALKAGSVITPTLTLLFNVVEANRATNALSGASGLSAFEREIEAASVNLAKAFRAGVPMLAGSEAGWSAVPFGQWHARELQVLVENLGLTPLEAINAGTLQVAQVMKRFGHMVGKLEAGRYADVLVVNGDPLADITILQRKKNLDYIFKGGRPVDRTPPAPRKRMWYEKQKTFVNGWLNFDEETGESVFVQ